MILHKFTLIEPEDREYLEVLSRAHTHALDLAQEHNWGPSWEVVPVDQILGNHLVTYYFEIRRTSNGSPDFIVPPRSGLNLRLALGTGSFMQGVY